VNTRLRELRAARRWSQADLADRLDVSRQTVNSIENGRYDPSLSLAFKIAAVFARPLDEIFFPADSTDPAAELPTISPNRPIPEPRPGRT
jgi:putative transcriptional regulator